MSITYGMFHSDAAHASNRPRAWRLTDHMDDDAIYAEFAEGERRYRRLVAERIKRVDDYEADGIIDAETAARMREYAAARDDWRRVEFDRTMRAAMRKRRTQRRGNTPEKP